MRRNQWFIILSIAFAMCLSACSAEVAERPATPPTEQPTTVAEEPTTAATAPISTPTDPPTAIPTPTPDDIFIYDEPIIFEQLPELEPLSLNLNATTGLIAYQQERQLWLNQLGGSENPVAVTACAEENTRFYCLPQLHWSPTGTHFFYETAVNATYKLIISDLQGQQQGFAISQRPYRTPVWSPDGRQLILFVGTDRPWGNHFEGDIEANEYGFLDEVWSLQMDEAGIWSAPQMLTELETPGIGCGGGGGSVSDALYESQDGFALGLQAAQKMYWTREDIIIYHLSCNGYLSQGYGRYDVQANQLLAPYDGRLHGLVLDASGSRWYAITGHEYYDENSVPNLLVTGTVNDTTYDVIETAVPVEMIFVGQQSGQLYYTNREQTEAIDISNEVPSNLFSPPYFHFYHTQLWTIQPDGSDERLLWESDDHSYSRVAETSEGNLLFILIENDVARYEAMTSGVPEVEWPEHFPHTHIMRLSPNNPEPEIFIEDARDLTVWYPQE